MLNRFRWLSVLAVTLFGFSLGCSTTPLLERKEYSEIQTGRRTLVLIRITMKLPDGTESGPWFRDDLIGDPQCFPSKLIGFGDFDTGGVLKPTEPFFLSRNSCEQGWAGFLLKPGRHYLRIPPESTRTWRSPWVVWEVLHPLNDPPLWRVDIPVGIRVAYIGSLHLKCSSDECIVMTFLEFQNEEDLAKKLAAKPLADLGPPQTLLMQRHSGVIVF